MLFCALSAGTVGAQNSGFAVSGAGASSCGAFIESEHDRSAQMQFTTWAQGFLSGQNMTESSGQARRMLLLPDGATIYAFIMKGCRDRPLETVVAQTMRLFEELRENPQYHQRSSAPRATQSD
jgi:hypothetical protein